MFSASLSKRSDADLVSDRFPLEDRHEEHSLPTFAARADGGWLWASSRWTEYTGLSSDDALGQGWLRAIFHADREACTSDWAAGVGSGHAFSFECRVRSRSGAVAWHLVHVERVDRACVPGWQGIFVDCSGLEETSTRRRDLTRLRRELAHAQRDLYELELASSHELREPLLGLHNLAAFIAEDFADRLDPEAGARLDAIQNLTKRLDALVASIADASRVRRSRLVREEVDLSELVGRVLEGLSPELSRLGARVEMASRLPTVRCDGAMASSAFRHLILNAVNYNDRPVKQVRVGVTEKGELYVSDNGIGIPAQHTGSVFRMFKRLHGRASYGGGIGTGLAIARRIVERHGGRLRVDSTPGVGTTFYFTFGIAR